MPKLLVKRYAADVEQIVLAHKHGYKIEECPVQIDFDPAGDRMKLKDILNIVVDTASIYYRLNILRYYDCPNGTLIHSNENVYRDDKVMD